MRLLLLVTALFGASFAWPDGAPCVRAAYESMNPLEAVEHQGGLQLTVPPYTIELEQKCYWKNQPIGVVLRGNSTKDKFKGFVIQPLVYQGSRAGGRIGQFLRLDDNGSWQQQCFRLKDSVTHSHQENKKKIRLWWKNDDDDSVFVQFVFLALVNMSSVTQCKQQTLGKSHTKCYRRQSSKSVLGQVRHVRASTSLPRPAQDGRLRGFPDHPSSGRETVQDGHVASIQPSNGEDRKIYQWICS
ncbi:hypothetical protein L596_022606 [Steinernema carpocapsae]|uniref:Reelin domain-containing protein n=1 Tax=Steinernema carpocapsae TaxID=34508 RepID=A0A4U5MMB0_STECR|nr:hypothetical protein L596_022606 [Steinernema carpocapsae]